MTHGIQHHRLPEPIVEVRLARAEADTLAQALAIAVDLVGVRHPLTARDLADARALLALLRASDRLPEVALPLTRPLVDTALGVAHASLYGAVTPGFAAGAVPTPEGQALAAALRGLNSGLLYAAILALSEARARVDAAVRLN